MSATKAFLSRPWPVDISRQMHPSSCSFDRAASEALDEARAILAVTENFGREEYGYGFHFTAHEGMGPFGGADCLAESLAAFVSGGGQ